MDYIRLFGYYIGIIWGSRRDILGSYRDNGKRNGNYCII